MASNTAVAGQSLAQTVTGTFAPGNYAATLWVRSNSAATVRGRLTLWGVGGGTDSATTYYTVGATWTPITVETTLTAQRTQLKLESYEDTTGVTYLYDSASIGAITVMSTVVGPPSGGRLLPSQLTVSSAGRDFVGHYEGTRTKPYNDPLNCTVGIGHLLHYGTCTSSELARIYTQAEVNDFFAGDIATMISAIQKNLGGTPMYQYEFDVLLDFAFNVGPGVTKSSNVHTALTSSPPNYLAVPADLLAYDHDANGKVVCGLKYRRYSEGQLWSTGQYRYLTTTCP